MSDGISDGVRMNKEIEAENAFFEAMIKHLKNPTEESLSVLDAKIEDYAFNCSKNKQKFVVGLIEVQRKLESNDKDQWESFIGRTSLFRKQNKEMHDMLMQLAHERICSLAYP